MPGSGEKGINPHPPHQRITVPYRTWKLGLGELLMENKWPHLQLILACLSLISMNNLMGSVVIGGRGFALHRVLLHLLGRGRSGRQLRWVRHGALHQLLLLRCLLLLGLDLIDLLL